MAMSLQTQVEELRASIAALEEQRGVLGDKVVAPALAASRQQLAILEERLGAEAAPADERRLVTILFTDMVGSTSAAEKLDPEEWRQLVSKLHATLGDSIIAHHGTIAQYLGDGLLAFFGAKEASEEDPENAIRAALDAQAAAGALPSVEKVQIRAGIHTGLVVVGELGADAHKEFTASGDAMNLAARLQSAAPPGGILISHDTYRYVRGVFDLTPRPPLTVKGKSEPIQTYLVRQAKPRPFRASARGVAGVEARTIGREAEVEALHAAYLQAYEGKSVVWAQLISDPGMGKSRLVTELNDWTDLREETYRVLRGRSFPDDANRPFAVVRRMWFDRFQIAEDTPLEQAEEKWVERFRELANREDVDEAAHALGLLVGLPFDNSPHIKALRGSPELVQGRALMVSRELIHAIRLYSPIVVLLEDLQWTDAASWEYLVDVLLAEAAGDETNGLFILGAARPEWTPPQKLTQLFQASRLGDNPPLQWGIQIQVEPLTDAATRELAQELFKRAGNVPRQFIDLLVERSEGVPYYAEEMVNWLIDNGILDTHSEPWRCLPERLKEEPLPATLQHLLLTRLSALSQNERATLQRGAIFGRRFWTGGLQALGVSGGAEVLGHLQPRGFVDVQPDSAFHGDTEWTFHQTLLQQVTYESVLKRERASLHKISAEWLEKQATQAGRLDEFAGLLADHYERAGELSAAADWNLRAGQRAMAQGAPREARVFYTQALDLLPPVDKDRRWQALLGREKALAVLGEGNARSADTSALVELARSFADDSHLAEALISHAIVLVMFGEELKSKEANEEALSAARRGGSERLEAKALVMLAALETDMGDKSASMRHAEEALQLARHLGDEATLAYVLHRVAYSCMGSGDIARASSLQREQIEISHRLGERADEALGLGNLGDLHREMGQYKQARTLLEQACLIDEGLGATRQMGYHSMTLGEVYLGTGDLRRALEFAERGMRELATSKDAKAMIYTLNDVGFILLGMGDAPGASRRFAEAHKIATDQRLDAPQLETQAGLAASAVMQGHLDEARKHAHEAWDRLKERGWTGLGYIGRLYRNLAETFIALGDDAEATEVLEAGHQALMDVAETINVPEWQQSFLQSVPDHRAIVEMWERRRA